jgi:hypothetical protein
MLRTPGLSINVGGRDDNETYKRDTPFRTFGHAFPSNWWCGVQGEAGNTATRLITGAERTPSPAFLSEAERAAVDQELAALTAAGVPRALLMSEAVAWAQTRRTDPDAAEALALAIEGWRWSPCSGQTERSDLPSRAFALLHRQFPDSEAAKRTKYWYD